MYPHEHIGIVAENPNQRVSIFDTDTLEVVQQIPLQADVIDAAITDDCKVAVVSSFASKTMFQICLCARPAKLVGSAVSPTFLEDVAITPDGRFALSVDGSAANQDIVSYSIRKNAFVSTLPTDAQAVAISPADDGSLVLTAKFFANSVRRFAIDHRGNLVDTGQEFPAGFGPNNLVFSRDGRFAFVADFNNGVSVLSTLIPNNIILLGSARSSGQPQSLAVTSDSRHVFALGSTSVDIYSFDPVAGSLSLERSFAHGLTITSFFGVDQIALDHSETRLFISAVGQVAVFTTYGLPLGTVTGAAGPGGLDICRCKRPFPPRQCEPDCRHCPVL